MTQPERDALALRKSANGRRPVLDWRLYAGITALVAVVGLMMASWLIWRDSQAKDHAAACRAATAAQLRDADSEVIRQTAIFKETEGGISQGLAAIVVALGRREPTDPEQLDALDHAQLALAEAK